MVNERGSVSGRRPTSSATWAARNGVSFGRGDERGGTERREVLEALLGSTEQVVQMVDSVEYG